MTTCGPGGARSTRAAVRVNAATGAARISRLGQQVVASPDENTKMPTEPRRRRRQNATRASGDHGTARAAAYAARVRGDDVREGPRVPDMHVSVRRRGADALRALLLREVSARIARGQAAVSAVQRDVPATRDLRGRRDAAAGAELPKSARRDRVQDDVLVADAAAEDEGVRRRTIRGERRASTKAEIAEGVRKLQQ